MRRISAVFLAGALVTAAASAGAAECAGVTFPDTKEIAGQALKLNGLGMREATIFKVDVYVAGLYVTKTSAAAEEIIAAPGPKSLSMLFVRDVSTEDLTGAWQEGFEKAAGDGLPALQDRVDQLNRWMDTLNKGDTMAFTYVPGTGTEIAVRGATKGVIPGDDFGRTLFTVWIGPEPPNEGLKAGLLGGSCG